MLLCNLVKGMVDDGNAKEDEPIVLPNIDKEIFNKVVVFCQYLKAGNAEPDIERPLRSNDLADHTTEYYTEFVEMPRDRLEDLLLAANYLDIKPLLELCCAKFATYLKGKTIEEIREEFKIENDFTPEEENEPFDESKYQVDEDEEEEAKQKEGEEAKQKEQEGVRKEEEKKE